MSFAPQSAPFTPSRCDRCGTPLRPMRRRRRGRSTSLFPRDVRDPVTGGPLRPPTGDRDRARCPECNATAEVIFLR